ncbi:MAG TPA: PHP domain-containing protein, partial [Desulfobaccales bacterium]|nr:PHP domain-containing protein [Desulfobaccales bacterium]
MDSLLKLIDLHIHSTASDGSYAPTEVVRQAREGGLAAIALTDHDTV